MSTSAASLAALVGAHPDALRALFDEGRATDPAELGAGPRGRILSVMPGADLFLLTRPLLRALADDRLPLLPWRGKVFDHGGNSGRNVVLFGQKVFRFHVEVGPSTLDGRPALVLDYSPAAYANPWPARAMRDELRTASVGGNGVAIGPAFLVGLGSPRVVLWFGLEMDRA